MDDKKTQEISGRVLGSFGLQCLKKALKDGKVLKDDDANMQGEDMKARLDPFVALLLEGFKTYHNPIIVTTLNVLGQIIHLGLPSFKELMKKFLNRLFKLFEQSNADADPDFLNSLFKCTSELIKNYATF